MKPCVEPVRRIAVHPTGTMANTWVKVVFDLRHMWSGKSLDSSIQIGEEAFAVMRSRDEAILRAVRSAPLES